LFYFLFAHNTTIIVVTKVPVHELDKKANKLALTVAHKHNRPLKIIQITVTNHKNHTISYIAHQNTIQVQGIRDRSWS